MNDKVRATMVLAAYAQDTGAFRVTKSGATELADACAAVAELIEAIDAERKGEYHDSEVEFRVNYDARRYQEKKRVDAALARVKGE